MIFYYAGINNSSLFAKNNDIPMIIDNFTEIPFSGLTNVEIGWNFILLWRNTDLYVSGKISMDESCAKIEPIFLKTPNFSERYKDAQLGMDNIFILTTDNDIQQYNIYEKTWKKVPNFIPRDENVKNEYVIKIVQTRCTIVLTNLGRVFNIPTLVDVPKRTKFVDIACGFDHTIMLAENGDVYSMGMGTRGQLGHGDLEDCDNPRRVEVLEGLTVIQISAGGWHSAVITEQGDLYTWGWNTNGELGLENDESKIFATPNVIDFKNEKGEIIEIHVKKVECGNNFTLCMLEDNSIWGCGSNKYGQLGQPCSSLKSSKLFFKLNFDLNGKSVKNFKCREWGTCIITD